MTAAMKKRILFGAIMTAGLAGLLLIDERAVGLPLVALVICIVPVAFVEVARLAEGAGAGLLGVSGLIGTWAIALWPYWCRVGWRYYWYISDYLMALVGLMLLPVFLEQMIRFRTADAFRHIAGTFLAVLYLGVGLAAMLMIRMWMKVEGLVLFLAAVKFTDIGAYFVGSAIGRHKLIPWLSPNKSWEGLAGGLATGAVAGAAAAWALRIPALPIYQAAAVGALLGLVGQFADLCESLLKRAAQAKDSGALVPQFGGVLDILDSLLLSAPVAYLVFALLPAFRQ